jgi:hypothetical protein
MPPAGVEDDGTIQRYERIVKCPIRMSLSEMPGEGALAGWLVLRFHMLSAPTAHDGDILVATQQSCQAGKIGFVEAEESESYYACAFTP